METRLTVIEDATAAKWPHLVEGMQRRTFHWHASNLAKALYSKNGHLLIKRYSKNIQRHV
jgi:hypothetical protein